MKTVKELWDDLFDSSLENYKHEDEAIRNLSMILHVLKLEYKKTSQNILELKRKNSSQSKEISEYKQKVQLCGCKNNNRTPLKTLNENCNVIETTPRKKSCGNQNISSYFNISDNEDMFNHQITELDLNVSNENDSLIVDNSLIIDDSVEDFETSCSPTLNKSKKRRLSRAKLKKIDVNKKSIKDIVMNTPTPKINKSKKFKQTKLTLSINNSNKQKNCTITNKDETKNAEKSTDSDETLFLPAQQNNEKQYGDTEVIDMLQQLRKVASPKNKTTKLQDSFDFIPERENNSPDFVYQRDAVRKKSERMKLQGWDCKDCEEYYATFKNQLSDKEIQKKMDECSRHRNKFNPNILTPKGFWNPDFSPTQDSIAFDI